MIKLNTLIISIFCALLGYSTTYAQTSKKVNFSSFSKIGTNDSVFVSGGQLLSGESASPRVLHGYLPFQSGVLKITEAELNFSVYPNPFSDQLEIHCDFDDGMIELRSMQGKQVFEGKLSNGHLVVSTEDLSKGMYLLFVSSGDRTITRRLIRQ